MGQAITKILDNGDEKEEQAQQQLEMMMKLADARLDTFEAELISMFLDKDSAAKRSVPGKRALRFERSVNVVTDSHPGDGVNGAVDAFFGIDDEGGSVKKGLLDGFKSVVKTGLQAFLGDSSAGESYDKKFFVCIKHNAIIRVDMYSYRYNFKNKGIVDKYKSILAYILCISVVDHNEVTVDEMVYLASEFAGDVGYEPWLLNLIRVWGELRARDQAIKAGIQEALKLPNVSKLSLTNMPAGALPPSTEVAAVAT